jgi:hypothetical protein
MPATLVHPAAVLPIFHLARRHLPLSALVIGSLSPDFEYLLRWGGGNRFSHELPWLAFCVPAGLLALWLFHALVKRPMLELLPERHRVRLLPHAGDFHWLPWTRLPLIVLAVTIGALTHMGWDAFTHYGGWGVMAFPALERVIFASGRMEFRVYNLFQYGSTPAGLAVIVAWYWLWVRRVPATDAPPRCVPLWLRWLVCASFVIGPMALGLAMGLILMGPYRGAFGLRQLVSGLGMGSHTGLYAFVLAYGAGFTLWQWHRQGRRDKIPAGDEP